MTRKHLILVTLCFLIAWGVLLYWGQELVSLFANGIGPNIFAIPPDLLARKDEAALIRMLFMFSLLTTLLSLVLLVMYSFRSFVVKHWAHYRSARAFEYFIYLGTSYVCFLSLYRQGFEGEWYGLEDVMRYEAAAPFNHRLLFVWLAIGIKTSFPAFSESRCYFLSQIPVILVLFYIIRKWAGLFAPQGYSWLAQVFLVLMLIPTVGYFTFYDFGVVLFSTLGLYYLFRGNLHAYYATLMIGTLNHEVIAILIPIFCVLYFDRMDRTRFAVWTLTQVLSYMTLRALLFRLLPMEAAWESGMVWWNIDSVINRPGPVLRSLAALVFWYVIAFLGFQHAPSRLRRCVVMLPLLLVMIFLVGQVNEPRLFNSFVPVVIGLVMTFVATLR